MAQQLHVPACGPYATLAVLLLFLLLEGAIGDVQVAASVSSLIHLTTLTLSIHDSSAHVDLDWLSQLVSLEELLLNIDVKQAVLSPTFVTLSRLVELALVGGSSHFDCDWKAMPALQHLWCSEVMGLTISLLGILGVKSLRRFHFDHADSVDGKAASVIRDLVDKLQCNRPDLELYVEYPALGCAGWL